MRSPNFSYRTGQQSGVFGWPPTPSTNLVSWWHPPALLDHLLNLRIDIRPGLDNILDSELLEAPGLLNVRKGSVQVLELNLHTGLGGLGVLDGLGLELVDGLELLGDVLLDGLEGLEAGLNLVDDGLVLQDGAVVGEVNLGGLLLEEGEAAASILVALLEGLEGGGGRALKAEGGGDFGPFDLERSASLQMDGLVRPKMLRRVFTHCGGGHCDGAGKRMGLGVRFFVLCSGFREMMMVV